MEIYLMCCMFILFVIFEVNSISLFLLEAGWFLIGRTVVHYRHPFASDQTYFSLVGLVQVYIACVRPTNVFRINHLC